MTIDAYDWAHRTGAEPGRRADRRPVHQPPGPAAPVRGHVRARVAAPARYYTDPFEANWVNEGLSDFAQTLTGYVDASKTVFERGADSHIYCFQGFGTRADAVQPEPARLRRPGELAEPVGRGLARRRCWPTTATPTRSCSTCTTTTARTLMSRLHRDGDLQGLAERQGRADRRGRAGPLPGAARLPDHRRWWTRSSADQGGNLLGVPKARVTTPEPALDGQPRQPDV